MEATKKKEPQEFDFFEILVDARCDCGLYYDRIHGTVEVCDMYDIYDIDDEDCEDCEKAEIRERLYKGEVIVFPTTEDLYPYSQALGDYLYEHGIEIPYGKRAIGYLAEKRMQYDFYEYRNEVMKKELLTWVENQKIPIKII